MIFSFFKLQSLLTLLVIATLEGALSFPFNQNAYYAQYEQGNSNNNFGQQAGFQQQQQQQAFQQQR